MPKIYQGILSGTVVEVIPSMLKLTPGGAILMDPMSKDMRGMFDAFCKYFRVQHPWIWTGAALTPSPGAILDGDANRGQCAALANAFRALAVQSKPYGLGMSQSSVGSTSDAQQGLYKGQYGCGFVSRHGDNTALGRVLSLDGNVYKVPANPAVLTPVTGGSPRSDLYLWENHKTVPYMGLYFDVLYGKIWDSKDQMALYSLRNPPVYRQQIHPTTNRVEIVEYTAATDALGRNFYFRSLTQAEMNQVGRVAYQGPFPALPGTAWDGPAPGNVAFRQTKFSK